jgi:hypothetical protein
MSQRHPRDPYQCDKGDEMCRAAADYGFEDAGGSKHTKMRHPQRRVLLIIPRGHLSKGVKLALAAAILGALLAVLA